MIAQRVAAVLASLVVFVTVAMTPAWATYPPGGDDDGVDVGGVKTGGGLDSGGLASTGFDLTYLWAGIAVLAVGVALLISARRRKHA